MNSNTHKKHLVVTFQLDGCWNIERVSDKRLNFLKREFAEGRYLKLYQLKPDQELRDVMFRLWRVMRDRYQIEPVEPW